MRAVFHRQAAKSRTDDSDFMRLSIQESITSSRTKTGDEWERISGGRGNLTTRAEKVKLEVEERRKNSKGSLGGEGRNLHLKCEGLVTIHELFFMYFQSIHASNLLDDRRSPLPPRRPINRRGERNPPTKRKLLAGRRRRSDLILRWIFLIFLTCCARRSSRPEETIRVYSILSHFHSPRILRFTVIGAMRRRVAQVGNVR